MAGEAISGESEDRQLELPIDSGTPHSSASAEEFEGEDEAVESSIGGDLEASLGEGPSAPPASPPTPTSEPSWRERAAEYGIDLSSYGDDESALKHLAERTKSAQEREALAAYGQEFVRHAADGSWQEYQDWKRQQQAASQASGEGESKLWDPPEWNASWLGQVKQDEDGNLVPDVARGGSPETVSKVQRYLQFRQDQQERFWNDPYRFMQPFVEKLADERARGLVEGELSRYGEQIDARHFITNNKGWLYKQSPDGQIAYENNQPVLSGEGQVFFNALQRVDGKSWSQADKQDYALEALSHYRQMEGLKSQASQQATGTPREAAEQRKESQLARAAGFVPGAGGSESQGASGASDETAQNENMTFREMLAAEFKAAGIESKDDLITA